MVQVRLHNEAAVLPPTAVLTHTLLLSISAPFRVKSGGEYQWLEVSPPPAPTSTCPLQLPV